MLGIQNSLPVTNSVRFGNNPYNTDDINAERDEKLQDIDGLKNEFNSLADTFDGSNNKVSKKAGKFARLAAAAVGLAATFVTAKYGSRVAINTFKKIGESKVVTKIVDKAKMLKEPIKKGCATVAQQVSNIVEKSGIKNSKIATTAKSLYKKEAVQNVVKTVGQYANDIKLRASSFKGAKLQSLFENTMGASAAASVLIDDLAGRNADKSALDIAMGASGGDK